MRAGTRSARVQRAILLDPPQLNAIRWTDSLTHSMAICCSNKLRCILGGMVKLVPCPLVPSNHVKTHTRGDRRVRHLSPSPIPTDVRPPADVMELAVRAHTAQCTGVTSLPSRPTVSNGRTVAEALLVEGASIGISSRRDISNGGVTAFLGAGEMSASSSLRGLVSRRPEWKLGIDRGTGPLDLLSTRGAVPGLGPATWSSLPRSRSAVRSHTRILTQTPTR